MHTTFWFTVAVLAAVLPSLWAPAGSAFCPRTPGAQPAAASPPDAPGTAGPPAPDFSLPRLDGGTFRLSDHRGQVVVVNFWATWCAPCREEIPAFMEVEAEFRDRGVVFVGVSVDEGGWDTVRPFAERLAISYTTVLDDGSSEAAYGPLAALPTTFIVDAGGRVFGYAPGKLTAEELRPAVEAALTVTP